MYAFQLFLPLPVFCEKTESILQDFICQAKLCVFTFKLAYFCISFIFCQNHSMLFCILTSFSPISKRVVLQSYSADIKAKEKSWTVIPITYDSGDEPRSVDMYAEIDDDLISFHKTVKIQPTYELYKSRFEAIEEKLGKIDALIESCKKSGIYVDYE